ncbi:MAG: flagellar hook-basal body protein [Spirochaetaceae bacterium]|jgi:flagellar basal-body rod protein FlgG|nr:flagellar hook-basal body protein [Spirochaetaceae bacterium]
MLRTWFTGASGMRAQQWRLDATANNLANVDTDGYKRDVSTFKAFPELLLRRTNDDGVYRVPPFGSADAAPIVGKLGTGVEFNELYTVFEQGAPKQTNNDFDLALDGRGFFAIETPYGERYTRNGSFHLGKEGYLETKEGYPVLGENGRLRVKANNFKVDSDGNVWINSAYADDPSLLISREDNTWGEAVLLDTLKITGFERERFLEKQGSSMYKSSEFSGEPEFLEPERRPRVLQGFTEASNVNPVVEMVTMIEVNRAYEANQKAVQAGDAMLGVLINQYGKVG